MEGLSKLILREKHDGIAQLLFVEDVLFGIGYAEEWSAFLDIINLLCALPQACRSILHKIPFIGLRQIGLFYSKLGGYFPIPFNPLIVDLNS